MSNASRALAGLATAVFGFMLAGCAGSGGDVASVNGEKISRSDFDSKTEVSPASKAVLNQMVQGILIDQYARDNKITIPDADVAKQESDIKARYQPGQFEQILKSQNLTEADVQRILRQKLIVEKAVAPSVKVSDADIKAYLDKNHATLDTPAQVQARHILVADPKTAADVEAQLKAGAKFEDMAKKYSTDPSSKDKGGELGLFGKGQMVPAFQAAAFSQAVGAIGPPVKSPFGYHIIQVEKKNPATVATLANSSDKIKTMLSQTQEQQVLPAFLAGLRAKANIQIFDPLLKDAMPPLPPSPAPSVAPAAPATLAPATPAQK
jgi:foldase protein PrsA